jgi:hypothetical protein
MTKQQQQKPQLPANDPIADAEAELNARVEAELNARIDARLQAERARERAAIAAQLRREDASKEYDRINSWHPIQGPGDPVFEAKRRADMDARAKADNEHMDRVNARPVPGSLAATRADRAGGSSGFRIKSGPR